MLELHIRNFVRQEYALIAIAIALTFTHRGVAQTVDDRFWITNGRVQSVVEYRGTVYIGGGFDRVGIPTGAAVPIDAETGRVLASFPHVNGTVRAVAADGSGGWFIGGDFTEVDGHLRTNLAHVSSNLTVSEWNPSADDDVFALTVSSGTVYVGGQFTTVGGQRRRYIAALDAATGLVSNWNPNANSTVAVLAASSGTVYAGGYFTSIGGQARNRIAALNTETGLAGTWNPNSNGAVLALAVNAGMVYAGGMFTAVGGQTRNRIAALSAATGSPTAWNPNASGWVFAIAVAGGTVYAGGGFTSVGGQARNYIAALDASTGQATAWNPNASFDVLTVVESGGTVYAGGDFVSIGGQNRDRIAALSTTSGLATSWDPGANYQVNAIALNGGTIYAGGSFTLIGGQECNNIAALDAATGVPRSWNPDANGEVYALAAGDGVIYAAGYFHSIGGQAREYLAALDAVTGTATAWNPSPNYSVRTIAVSGSTVYVGGWFTFIGGQARNAIAALDAVTGAARSWNPNANPTRVDALAVGGAEVYASGLFTAIGGQSRRYLAALDATTGMATVWNPGANSPPQVLAVDGRTVYAGGGFTTIGGQARNYVAALDAETGLATDWNPNADSNVEALAVSGGIVYAGGNFATIGGLARSKIAALDAATGLATEWDPHANNQVYGLAVGSGRVFAGGYFTYVGGGPQSFIAAISAPVEDSTWPICTAGPCLRFRVESYPAPSSSPTPVASVRLATLPGANQPEILAPVVNGFAVIDATALTGLLVNPIVNPIGLPISYVELRDAGGAVLGHIPFNYNRWDLETELKAVDAFLFVHEYDTPTDVPGWEYFANDEYPVSMLLPPREDIARAQGGSRTPLLFVHGVAGEYPEWDDYYHTNSIPWLLDGDRYDGWQFYYPYDQEIERSAEYLSRAIAAIRVGALTGAPTYDGDNRVYLVAHSMGGLVARYSIQNGGASSVSRLLMLGTPNHGSHAAYQLVYGGLLGAFGEAVFGTDKEAPSYAQMIPGSDFLRGLNAGSLPGLRTGAVDRDYLVIAGVEDFSDYKGPYHSEIAGQEDGAVAVASASIVDKGVPLALVREDHEDLHWVPNVATAIGLFGEPAYDPATMTIPSWLTCKIVAPGQDVCASSLGVAAGSILTLSLGGIDSETDNFRVSVDGTNHVIVLDRNDKVGGRPLLQRIGASETFFSRLDRAPLNALVPIELDVDIDPGQYGLRIRGKVCEGQFGYCTSWWVDSRANLLSLHDFAATGVELTLGADVVRALNAPNAEALRRSGGKTASYEFAADAAMDTLIFALSSTDGVAGLLGHDLTLVDPDGRVVDPAVALTDPEIDYHDSSERNLVQYAIAAPTEGLWTVRHGDAVTGPQVLAFMYGSYRTGLRFPNGDVAKGDSLAIEVIVRGGDECSSQSLALNVLYSASEAVPPQPVGSIPLVETGPGAYRGYLVPESAGSYGFALSATCERTAGGAITRAAFASVWANEYAALSAVDPGMEPRSDGGVPAVDLQAHSRPNPFNPRTVIEFAISVPSPVSINVYDLGGRLVRHLLSERSLEAGLHDVSWDGRSDAGTPLPSAVYFCRIEAGRMARTIKMALLK